MTYDALLNIEPELVSPEWLHSLCSMLVKKFVCSPLLIGHFLLRAFEVLEEVNFSSFSGGIYCFSKLKMSFEISFR
jgi:hypothetical protein